jgi:hypothetical protein
MNSEAPYPTARTRIALPLNRGEFEFRKASIASAMIVAFTAVIEATQAISAAVGGAGVRAVTRPSSRALNGVRGDAGRSTASGPSCRSAATRALCRIRECSPAIGVVRQS